jgi:ABC-type hemin transport system substrate-binding protein
MLCGLLGLLIGVVGCDRTPVAPNDVDGMAAQPTTSAIRLAVLSPALATILRDLGAGDLIVARHDFDRADDRVPAAGHQGAIDYEMLLAVRPTHVHVEWGRRPVPARLVSLAEREGWTLMNHTLETLDDITRTADALHAAYGETGTAAPGASLAQAWARREPPLESVGRVLLLGSIEPPAAFGPGSFHYQLLTSIGATPAIALGSAWVELDHEDLIALSPDAIVLIEPRPGGRGRGAMGRAALDALGSLRDLPLPAIVTGRVAVLDGELYHTPSTAMAACARDLAAVLSQWRDEKP